MNQENLAQINEMTGVIEHWLHEHEYSYIECNSVPKCLFTKSQFLNLLIKQFYRLCPFNIRPMRGNYPDAPQSIVTMLKAYNETGNIDVVKKLYARALNLRCPKTKYFSLKQGIPIITSTYENSKEEHTPLNTVWFGHFILEEQYGLLDEKQKKEMLISISEYLIKDLGYADYQEDGIYFYYGPTLKKVIYNASAVMSAFLIIVGKRYNIDEYVRLGERGIQYICNHQNTDGSWFYAAPPLRSTIDCFHHSYILQALCSVRNLISIPIEEYIEKGTSYYKTMFVKKGNSIRPIRYDKRYTPRNTWLVVKVDGRDIVDALLYFSLYEQDEKFVIGLLNYTYQEFYDKRKEVMHPEIFLYGKNRNVYIEFHGWFLYALNVVKKVWIN